MGTKAKSAWKSGSAGTASEEMQRGDVIETEKLTKSYGSHRGIIEVDLAVQAGEVFGFLGPNGAGKTTTIRTLLDLIRPPRGSPACSGSSSAADPVAIHRRVGYLPGEFALYDRLTGGAAPRVLREPARRRRSGLPGQRSSNGSTSTRRADSASTARATSRRWVSSSPSSTARSC